MTAFQTTRRTLLQLIGSLPVFRAVQGRATSSFTLVPAFAPGQVMRYRLESNVVRNGALGHRSRSTVTLEIVDRRADGWLARWTSSDGELVDADPRMRPMLAAVQGLWDGVAIDLLLDAGGRVEGLADPAAVRALGETCLDRLVALLAADPQRAPMAAPLRAALAPTLDDGGMLSQSLIKEPAILLGAMGHDYRIGEPLEVRTRIASPLGSGEIPVLGRYQVRGIASRELRADIGGLMVIDRATAARTLGAEIAELVRGAGAATTAVAGNPQAPISDAEVSDLLATLDFDDRADFIVDTSNAWPVRVSHVRRVSAGAWSRVDSVELTRLAGRAENA